MPVAINMMQGRRKLPKNRAFVLPEAFAWFANGLGVAYVIITTVLFLFPPALPVDAMSMNYCVVAFAVWMFIAMVQWFVDGRKNYTGPKVDIDERRLSVAVGPAGADKWSDEETTSKE
jgi:choline transport protein